MEKSRLIWWGLAVLLIVGCVNPSRTKKIPPRPPMPQGLRVGTSVALMNGNSGEFPPATSCPEKIHRNSRGGWQTIIKGFPPANSLWLAKWSSPDAIAFLPLNSEGFDIRIDGAFHGQVGNAYIVGGSKANAFYKRPEAREFDANTGEQRLVVEYGDARDTDSAATPLLNGGLAGVTFSGPGVLPNNIVRFTAFYRRLGSTYDTNNWWFQRFEFPSVFGTAALIYFTDCVQDKNGIIWVFFTRDSAGTVGLARFDVQGNGLRLLDFDQSFIPTGTTYSPSHEFPRISAVIDEAKDRILLCYQNSAGIGSGCQDREITSFWSVTQVAYDKRTELVGTSTWVSPHIDFPKPAIFPRANGVYFTLFAQNLETCGLATHQGIVEGSQYRITESNHGNGKVLGFSPDGWVLFNDWDTGNTELLRTQFGPKMSIARSGQSAVIRWDNPNQSDVLEASLGPGSWFPVRTGLPPATITLTGQGAFFRVRQ